MDLPKLRRACLASLPLSMAVAGALAAAGVVELRGEHLPRAATLLLLLAFSPAVLTLCLTVYLRLDVYEAERGGPGESEA